MDEHKTKLLQLAQAELVFGPTLDPQESLLSSHIGPHTHANFKEKFELTLCQPGQIPLLCNGNHWRKTRQPNGSTMHNTFSQGMHLSQEATQHDDLSSGNDDTILAQCAGGSNDDFSSSCDSLGDEDDGGHFHEDLEADSPACPTGIQNCAYKIHAAVRPLVEEMQKLAVGSKAAHDRMMDGLNDLLCDMDSIVNNENNFSPATGGGTAFPACPTDSGCSNRRHTPFDSPSRR